MPIAEKETKARYSVNLWGSDPEEGNDDHWMGIDFVEPEEAFAAFSDPDSLKAEHHAFKAHVADRHTIFIELAVDGATTHSRRLRPDATKPRASGNDWRRELAWEAGMLHGVDAYNDAMGWGTHAEEC